MKLDKNKGIYTKEEVEKLFSGKIKLDERKGIYTKEEVEKLLKQLKKGKK